MEEITQDETSIQFYEELIKSISEPAPMALVIVKFEVTDYIPRQSLEPNIQKKLPEAVRSAVHDRLKENLRKYDILSHIHENIYVAVIKTLKDESELQKRMINLEKKLQLPYIFKEVESVVEVELGLALRKPGETPSNLLQRADSKFKRFTSQS